MTLPELRSDCARCAGLCCMALAFDSSDKFGFDKPAGEACRHLTARFRCAIHDRRHEAGFKGCAAYDCLGAGQRVTQEIFPGQDWRADGRLKLRMIESFRAMRLVHRLLDLLELAGQLPLAAADAQERRRLEAALCPSEGWSEATLGAVEHGPLPREIAQFMRRQDRAAAALLARKGGAGAGQGLPA